MRLWVELIYLYGADPAQPDFSGLTPFDHAKQAGHKDLANRLFEIQYEVTDRLSFYLCGKKPDHSPSPLTSTATAPMFLLDHQHFLVPEVSSALAAGSHSGQQQQSADSGGGVGGGGVNAIKRRMKGLSDLAFEKLIQDVYDEVDRREIDAAWSACLSDDAFMTGDRYVVPFLPVNSDLPSVRNQYRQKLAKFTGRELAALIVDLLSEAKRRCCNCPSVPQPPPPPAPSSAGSGQQEIGVLKSASSQGSSGGVQGGNALVKSMSSSITDRRVPYKSIDSATSSGGLLLSESAFEISSEDAKKLSSKYDSDGPVYDVVASDNEDLIMTSLGFAPSTSLKTNNNNNVLNVVDELKSTGLFVVGGPIMDNKMMIEKENSTTSSNNNNSSFQQFVAQSGGAANDDKSEETTTTATNSSSLAATTNKSSGQRGAPGSLFSIEEYLDLKAQLAATEAMVEEMQRQNDFAALGQKYFSVTDVSSCGVKGSEAPLYSDRKLSESHNAKYERGVLVEQQLHKQQQQQQQQSTSTSKTSAASATAAIVQQSYAPPTETKEQKQKSFAVLRSASLNVIDPMFPVLPPAQAKEKFNYAPNVNLEISPPSNYRRRSNSGDPVAAAAAPKTGGDVCSDKPAASSTTSPATTAAASALSYPQNLIALTESLTSLMQRLFEDARLGRAETFAAHADAARKVVERMASCVSAAASATATQPQQSSSASLARVDQTLRSMIDASLALTVRCAEATATWPLRRDNGRQVQEERDEAVYRVVQAAYDVAKCAKTLLGFIENED